MADWCDHHTHPTCPIRICSPKKIEAKKALENMRMICNNAQKTIKKRRN